MTPLLSTIEGNQIEATKYLLTNGANPNPKIIPITLRLAKKN